MFKFLCHWVAWNLNNYHESYSEDHNEFHMPTSSWSILMTRVCLFFSMLLILWVYYGKMCKQSYVCVGHEKDRIAGWLLLWSLVAMLGPIVAGTNNIESGTHMVLAMLEGLGQSHVWLVFYLLLLLLFWCLEMWRPWRWWFVNLESTWKYVWMFRNGHKVHIVLVYRNGSKECFC